jgi:acyl carrier protein
MTNASTLESVRKFITENFYIADKASLTDDASLLDKGIIDSTGVLEVVAFLESEFGISVDDAEILPENLDTIAAIGAYVERKKAG